MASKPVQKNTIYKIKKSLNFWGIPLLFLMALGKKGWFLIMLLDAKAKLKKYLENKPWAY